MLLASILVLALTRAEIIDRFRAAPVTQVDGLVQVFGDCPADMRRDFQLPIASFVSDICRKLYEGENKRPLKFREPGIIVRIGDVRTNIATVVSRPAERDEGVKFTRIYIPSPSGADIQQLRVKVIQAFCRAVDGEEVDEKEAIRRYRLTDPHFRVADLQAELDAWRQRGEYAAGKTDEDYLKVLRGVHLPGVATETDVRNFASRLYLYPAYYGFPFCGKYSSCPFREAIALAKEDPFIRLAAFDKVQPLTIFGQGHGDKMNDAVATYVKFLLELARYEMSEEELSKILDEADAKLKGVLEK